MRRAILAGVLLAACASSKKPAQATTDSLTRRERDSTIGASAIPGAQGVQKAMNAADSGAARAARVDSVAGE